MRLDTELWAPYGWCGPGGALSCLSPARSIALLYVYGHSRSSAVSSASAEHGASTGTWEGAPSGRSPRGVYSPALTCGWHGRAWRGVSGHP